MSTRSDDVEDEDWPEHKVYVDQRVRICAQLCETCVFRPGNLMQLQPGRVKDMVATSLANDSTIVCHKTLGEPLQAVCRGFYNRYWRRNWLLRLANSMNVILEVDV